MTRINIILIFCILICGCVERKITITTDPPGAFVWLDGKKIGKTPLETPFIFHGTREITLQKKGYEIQSNMEPISIPWFQLFPIDFFTEFCGPEISNSKFLNDLKLCKVNFLKIMLIPLSILL